MGIVDMNLIDLTILAEQLLIIYEKEEKRDCANF